MHQVYSVVKCGKHTLRFYNDKVPSSDYGQLEMLLVKPFYSMWMTVTLESESTLMSVL